jgi:virginiamycin B lyase
MRHRDTRRAWAWLLLAGLLLLSVPGPSVAFAEIDETRTFDLKGGIHAQSLAFGSDGNLWFTTLNVALEDNGLGEGLGQMTLRGEVTEFPLESNRSRATSDIVAAPDGDLWFTLPAAGSVGRRTPGGQTTLFPLSDRAAAPEGIEIGPDGGVWFTESKVDRVARIDSNGWVTEVDLPAGSKPAGIASGPRDLLWVAERGSGRLARIQADGAVSQLALPGGWIPTSIAVDVFGNVWFADSGQPRTGRIGPEGNLKVFHLPVEGGITPLAVAGDGRAWYAAGTRIGSISPDGRIGIPACAIPTCDHAVTGMTVGPDGGLWFGMGTRIVTGGGGSGQFTLPGEPGLIGRFVLPVHAVIGPKPAPLKGSFTSVDIWCDGGAAERACQGDLTAYARFRVSHGYRLHERRWLTIADRSFGLAPGTGRRVGLEISPRGRRAVRRHGQLEVRVSAYLDHGQGATRDIVVRPFRRR